MANIFQALTGDDAVERNFGLWAAIALNILFLLGGAFLAAWLFWGLILSAPLLLIALWDLVQTKHSLRRNYPLAARFRWLFEDLRPFLRSYIVEGPLEGRPYDRVARSLVYARTKRAEDAHPFGTELDVYSDEYEALGHSIAPRADAQANPRECRYRAVQTTLRSGAAEYQRDELRLSWEPRYPRA